MSQSVTAQLRRALHDLDELRDAHERADLYEALACHLKSAAPLQWVEDIERRIATRLAEQGHAEAARYVAGGDWRNGNG